MTWKRIIIVTAIAAVVLMLGYLLWQSLTSPVTAPEPPATGGALPGGSEIPTATGTAPTSSGGTPLREVSIQKVSRSSALAYWVTGEGGVFYIGTDGAVYTVGPNEDFLVSTQRMSGVRDVQLNAWDDDVLVAFGPVGNASWGIFKTSDRAWSPLPADLVDVTWGTKANELIATVRNTDNSLDLVSMDLSRSTTSRRIIVRRWSFAGTTFRVRLPDTLVISERPSGLVASRVWELNLRSLSVVQTAAPETGAFAAASRNGNFTFQFSGNEKMTYLITSSTRSTFATLPSKCFSGATSSEVYCFVPRTFNDALLPDDYLQGLFSTNDSLYRASANSVESVTIPLTSNLDAFQPLYADDAAYFINRPDGFVYKIAPLSAAIQKPIGL